MPSKVDHVSYKDAGPVTLVVGSDGLIGRALMTHMEVAASPVIGTTRRKETVDERHIYLDLSQDVDGWESPQPIAVAVICAGVTRLEACRKDPEASAHVNVQSIGALAKTFASDGTFVVYLSTNQVFDGTTPHAEAKGALCPVTEYGRQKAEAERQIGRVADSAAIVRLTKVLGPTEPLFVRWCEALRIGTQIEPFSDLYMAPVPLACAVSILQVVCERRLPGVLQVSGPADISYAEAARMAARLMEADPTLVRPVEASSSGHYSEPVPRHTTLNTDRLKSALGVVPPDSQQTIEMTLTHSGGG